jgi:hypothetical protein
MNSGKALDGFLARFILLETPVNYPDPQMRPEPMEQRLPAIADSLKRLVVGPGVEPTPLALGQAKALMEPVWVDQGGGRRAREVHSPRVPVVPMTEEAIKADEAVTWDELERKRANEGKSLATAIIARTSEHVRRLALIRAVSRNPKEPVVDGEDMLWAEKVVQLSQRLMIPAVEEHVADTPWEANLKKLHRIIRAHGGWMDGTTLNNRCKFLNSRDRDQALRQLEESDLIEIRMEPTATKPRRYYRSI